MFAGWRQPAGFLERMDAPFFAPEHVALDKRLDETLVATALGPHLQRVFKGAFYVLASEYASEGVPFIRVADITSGEVDLSRATYLPPDVHARESKTAVRPGDLLFAKGGSIGNSAVVPGRVIEANISQDVIGARVRATLDAYFAQAFLSSGPGVQQMVRWAQGNVHPHITNDAVRNVRLPLARPHIQRAIGNKLRKAERLRERASRAWGHALTRLAAGVDHAFDAAAFDAPRKEALNRPGYRCISLRPAMAEAAVTDEIGAQYFHPRRQYARRVAAQTGRWQTLEELARPVGTRGRGRAFLGLDRIDSHTGVIAPATDNDPAEGVLFEADDILFSRLRPYLNKVTIWAGPPGVGSPELLVFRPRGSVDPHYLFAAVKSPIGLYQVIDVTSGSTHPRVDDEVVAGIRVPRLPEHIEGEIGDEVRAAMLAWTQAPPLVSAAKAAVEALIDGALDEASLLAESDAIERWLAENPSPSKGA